MQKLTVSVMRQTQTRSESVKKLINILHIVSLSEVTLSTHSHFARTHFSSLLFNCFHFHIHFDFDFIDFQMCINMFVNTIGKLEKQNEN